MFAMLGRAERHQMRVSFLLTDIDHLKKINDTHGHPNGGVRGAGGGAEDVTLGVAGCDSQADRGNDGLPILWHLAMSVGAVA